MKNTITLNFIAETITQILKAFLEKGTGKKLQINERGLYELRMPKFYLILGCFCTMLSLAFVGAMFFSDSSKKFDFILFSLVFGMFAGFGIWSILLYKNHKVLFDETYIEVFNAAGKSKTTRWVDFSVAKFTYNTGMLALKDHNQQKLSINQHLIGLGGFMQMMEAKTAWSAESLKMSVKKI
jgi:H+/Cl- antiporter ClcA